MMEEGEPVSLNESTWSKIEESVREILATSDLETATEFSVRSAAAHRLGLDLSGFAVQQLIRQVVDIFLLSTAVRNLLGADNNTSANNDNGNNDGAELPKDYTGKLICQVNFVPQIVFTFQLLVLRYSWFDFLLFVFLLCC